LDFPFAAEQRPGEKMVFKKLRYLLNPEESNIYLSVGVVALFTGISLIYFPAGLIAIGIIFIAIGYLKAQGEAE
jgi:hypothetical protein